VFLHRAAAVYEQGDKRGGERKVKVAKEKKSRT